MRQAVARSAVRRENRLVVVSVAEVEEVSVPEKSAQCTRHCAPVVGGRRKCLSSLAKTDQSTVAIVTSLQSVLREVTNLAGNHHSYCSLLR
jgi:hypothetical protein